MTVVPATIVVTSTLARKDNRLAHMAVQIGGLWLISAGCNWLAQSAHLPIPGNVIGLIVLFLALMTGVVKLSWFDTGGGILTKHLAFFFIPITVGLMGFGATFATAGIALAATLVLSGVVGLLAAAYTAQLLANRSLV
jgi:holin-like protein